ncbi:MAG: hypothetical protein V4506_14490 [Bacteroidota bacterium]
MKNFFKRLFKAKDLLKLPQYRIRIEELNNGSKKFFPEFKTSTFGYSQIVYVNGIPGIVGIENRGIFFNNTEEDAARLINLHHISEINKKLSDIKSVTITPYIPKHNATEIPLPRAQKRGYEHPDKFSIQ